MVEKQHQCDYCEHRFHTNGERRRHMRQRHRDRLVGPVGGVEQNYWMAKTVVEGGVLDE